MFTRRLTIALAAAGLLGVGGWLMTHDVKAEDTESPEALTEQVEAETWTGRIVSVHDYLTRDEAAEAGAADEPVAPEADDLSTENEPAAPEADDFSAEDEPAAPEADDFSAEDETAAPEADDFSVDDEPVAPEGNDRSAWDETVAPEADGPIALLVTESGVIEKLVPGRTLHLIMFDPADDASKDAYRQARELSDQQVSVTGKHFDRDGVSAISIEMIEEDTSTTADADAPSPELGS